MFIQTHILNKLHRIVIKNLFQKFNKKYQYMKQVNKNENIRRQENKNLEVHDSGIIK